MGETQFVVKYKYMRNDTQTQLAALYILHELKRILLLCDMLLELVMICAEGEVEGGGGGGEGRGPNGKSLQIERYCKVVAVTLSKMHT